MAILDKVKSPIKKLMPKPVLGGYHYAWAFLAAVRYGFPARKLKVIGVTGTNGKSTTIELIAAILKEAGYRVALSSSIKFEIAGETRKNSSNNSMPGRFALQKLLAQAAQKKCDYAIVEVTSEGITQHRHRFIGFTGAVFTNLTPEHIESHGGFDNYRKAKQKLFAVAKGFHVINRDDENANYFLGFKAKKKYCYGLCPAGSPSATGEKCETVCAADVRPVAGGTVFSVNGQQLETGLAGLFNVYNALAAVSLAMAEGIGLDVCRKALARVRSVPGRMEKVSVSPLVFVDYAFTPNALKKVYAAVRKDFLAGNGKLICLLGACGNGRDKWKRPILGQIAGQYCDKIILADEDPWGEDPRKIIGMVKEGVIKSGFDARNLYVIPDRRRAVAKAVSLVGNNDAIVLTGKGSEAWIRFEHGKKIPWDEKKAVLEELAKAKR